MTPDQVRVWLAGLQQECDAATPGPWEANSRSGWVSSDGLGITRARIDWSKDQGFRSTDATFVASSRSSVPALIAMVTAVLDLADQWQALGTVEVFETPIELAEILRAALAAATGDQT